MINKTPPKGMRDFLPRDLAMRNRVISKIKEAYVSFGFAEIETPCVDDINLLLSKQGGDNEKLIYKILKRGEKLAAAGDGDLCDLGLRFDLTLPLARYYANNIGGLPPVFKAIQAGPVFRADRPQKGRYRQFVQCDIDIIGEESVFAETELILATARALQNVGLEGFTIKINDRRILRELLVFCGFESGLHEKALISLDKLDKIGSGGVKEEMLAYAPANKVEKFLSVSEKIASSENGLAACAEILEAAANAARDLERIISAVKAVSGAKPDFDITLVRGMNYYTGAIFEIYAEGIPYALGGGGRYDKLIGKITGTDVPACGFSIGFERIVDLLAERGAKPVPNGCAAIIVPKEQAEQTEKIFAAAQKLREIQSCTVYRKMKNFAYQLKTLSENGCGKFYMYDDGNLRKI